MRRAIRYAIVQDHDDPSSWVTLWYMPHARIHHSMYGLDGVKVYEMPRNWWFVPCN